MSEKKTEYNLLYLTDSWAQRTVGSILFYGFLAFMVWLSNGSTWWTFLFGCVALLALIGRGKYYWDNYHHRFYTKAELREYVETLPE